MRKPIKVNLDELVEAGILSASTADNIISFQQQKEASTPNRLLLAFGILGAILVGLGIILIIAHNWDQFPRFVKLFFAFLPLLIGQIACGYTLMNKPSNRVWRESASVFLVFGIGASIAMVSQIYNIEGDLGSFLLTWLLLGLPLIYVMNSSAVSLLYIAGVIWFTMESGYDGANSPWICWGLLAAALPHYYQLWKHHFTSNIFNIHSWAIAFSGPILLATWSTHKEEWLSIAYVSGMAIYYFFGQLFLANKKTRHNPFLLMGAIGTIITFLFLSFQDSWRDILRQVPNFTEIFQYRESIVAFVLTLVATSLLDPLILQKKNFLNPVLFGFLLFILLIFIAPSNVIPSVVLANIFVFLVGVFYIYEGSNRPHLGMLNLGLITISILIIARFMDIDMSFIARGLLFIIMGIGFFYANYRILKNE